MADFNHIRSSEYFLHTTWLVQIDENHALHAIKYIKKRDGEFPKRYIYNYVWLGLCDYNR